MVMLFVILRLEWELLYIKFGSIGINKIYDYGDSIKCFIVFDIFVLLNLIFYK